MAVTAQESVHKLRLKDAVKKALVEFVRRLQESEGDNLIRVALFGSMARGDFDDNSDTDVFVLLHEGDPVQKMLDITDIATDVSYDIAFKDPDNVDQWYVLLSPLVETEAALKRQVRGIPRWRLEPVFKRIDAEGVSLFERDGGLA
ncbi:MAG: nucleotidyltransferase domain-containing protein [Fretibacterium sp.]|nr:nucleotidyltransferase domain-containing protein [Fretibacterium sp.]